MANPKRLALEATKRIGSSPGFWELSAAERANLRRDLAQIQAALADDSYDTAMDTPASLQRDIATRNLLLRQGQTAKKEETAPPAPRGKPSKQMTSVIGERSAEALDAVDFPGFVAGLVTGTFQAIVDATAQQVREYANLVSSIARSVDDFSKDSVTAFQVREWLADKHSEDLRIELPQPGSGKSPRLLPRPNREGKSPTWLKDYDLQDESLSEEVTNRKLVLKGRNRLGEERLQALASMVLMGINRVVVNEGQINARLQFHAAARDSKQAEIANLSQGRAIGIAGRQVSMKSAAKTQVSTLKANTQADASIKANLMGEVRLKFSTETFSLERFADSPAIQLINRHARWTPQPASPKEGSSTGSNKQGTGENN